MANLLEKSSIIITPTAYDEGSINAVKPIETIGDELIINNDFTDGGNNWTIQNDVTFSNDTAIIDATSGNAYINQNALTVGAKYKVSITLDSLDISNKCDLINASGVVYKILSVGVNEFEIEANQTAFRIRVKDNATGVISNTSAKQIINADLDFVRNTLATRVNSQGLIENVNIVGTELVENGDFSINSDWTLGDGWSIDQENNKATCDGTQTAATNLDQVLGTNVQNDLVRISFTLSDYSAGNLSVSLFGTGEVEFLNLNQNGNYSVNATSADAFPTIRFQGDVDFIGSVTNISIKQATNDTDLSRIDYLGGVGHWLIEPEVINTATYSNDFTQGNIFSGSSNPAAANSTLTLNQIASPDGTTNAMKLTCDTSGNIHHIKFENVEIASDNTNIISLFVKKGSGVDWFAIAAQNYDAPDKRAWFNVNTGVLGTQSNVADSTIEDYGDGWYRCSMAFKTTTDVSGTVRLIVTNANNETTFVGDGEFHYYYGLQCETSDNDNATKPTSYIPTNGSTVTRERDRFGFNTTLDTSLINSEEGTFYAEISALQNDGTERTISISDGSITNTIWFRFRGDNVIQVRIYTNLGATTTISTTTTTTNFIKLAARFKTNDIAFYLNGSLVNTNTTNPTFSANTLNKIRSGRGDMGEFFRGKIKCIAVFKEALTDSELQCLTTTSTN